MVLSLIFVSGQTSIEPTSLLSHFWACPKLCQIFSQLHFKKELSWKVGLFCMLLGIHGSYKFIHSIRVGVVRHTQSDWKQWVNDFSKMNLVWIFFFFFFLMWLGMHKYVSTIKSIHICFVKREMTRTHQELIRIYQWCLKNSSGIRDE